MFNVTVINIKEIIKYLVCLTLVILAVVGLTKYINSIKNKANFHISINSSLYALSQSNMIQCLDKTIPAIEEKNNTINTIAQEDENNTENILTKVLKIELAEVKPQNIETPTEADETQNPQETTQTDTTSPPTEEQYTKVVTENPIITNPTNTYGAVQIKNETSKELTQEMLTPDINITNKNILIFHTHTCESYTATEQYSYTPTGSYRTTDLNYTVARVGDELTTNLIANGFNVTHDKTYHDYPAYNGSYTRSLKTVEELQKTVNADIVIDLHRDAIGSNSNYAPLVKIGDDYAAQIMFVVGSDGGGLFHPNWNQNLKFAVKVQEKAEELYPGLFKPIILRNSRYNQHVSNSAVIIEVGATGNTLEQCMCSMKYLANIFSALV